MCHTILKTNIYIGLESHTRKIIQESLEDIFEALFNYVIVAALFHHRQAFLFLY